MSMVRCGVLCCLLSAVCCLMRVVRFALFRIIMCFVVSFLFIPSTTRILFMILFMCTFAVTEKPDSVDWMGKRDGLKVLVWILL